MNETFEKLWNETGAKLVDDGIGYRLYEFENISSEDNTQYGLQLNITGEYSVIKQDGMITEKYPKVIDDFANQIFLILNRDNANV